MYFAPEQRKNNGEGFGATGYNPSTSDQAVSSIGVPNARAGMKDVHRSDRQRTLRFIPSGNVLRNAANEWRRLCGGGEPDRSEDAEPLEPNTGTELKKTLRRQGHGNARGTDSDILARRERRHRWPRHVRQVGVSLIPKANAEREAQLRPIGLLTDMNLAWMATNKGTVGNGHSRSMTGGKRGQLPWQHAHAQRWRATHTDANTRSSTSSAAGAGRA